MAGVLLEDKGVGGSDDGNSSSQSSPSGEAIAEWRSSEQLENGTQLTTAPFWDSDNDDDGPKPSELYGRYTWKIEKFWQITKRELRSSAFEVGGYKWYILIYPQGCDVCNHLSLFLCVADHDKLLPGWSHFAQFTIAVVNKDPKKSKYSDTLHRFWKKEHDWGWKKFMELSKMLEGFIDEDTLIIKAQVQVIREKADRPFRCLDFQYRRELVRVYLTNVEQICRRFVEERRGKLVKLIEDKARWKSFRAFWLNKDPDSRRSMSSENTDVILKVVVKHFFIEKEVTSTLVMDSLYSGLKALESHSKCKTGRTKRLDIDDMPAPIIRVEQDAFVLVDEVLPLLERATIEPLPPKDEKGPQNRTKDGNSGEDFNKDSVERDERRLTELGRRTLEIFVLAHIFSSKIDVAYKEAIALKRQEELIREEEAAWHAESEQRAKRGANTKEKKSKKKPSKQKRNNLKTRDKEREDRPLVPAEDEIQRRENPHQDVKEVTFEQEVRLEVEKAELLDDVSDVSDLVECVADTLLPDSEERDASPINWDTDTSEVQTSTEASGSTVCLPFGHNGTMHEKRIPSAMDDNSSTCSSDSVPSVLTSRSYQDSSFLNQRSEKSPSRGKSQRFKATSEVSSRDYQGDRSPSGPATADAVEGDALPTSKAADFDTAADAPPFQHHDSQLKNQDVKRDEAFLEKRPMPRDQTDEVPKVKATSSGQSFSSENSSSTPWIHLKSDQKSSSTPNPTSSSMKASSEVVAGLKPEVQRSTTSKPTEKPSSSQGHVMSRPSSAPLVPGVRPPVAPPISMVQPTPLLSRSVSAVGRLGPEPSASSSVPNYVPQSYRNATVGNSAPSSSSTHTYPSSPSSAPESSQGPTLVSSAPMFLPSLNERIGFLSQRAENGNLDNGVRSLEYYKSSAPPIGSRDQFLYLQAGPSGRQVQAVGLSDDFPHLDIINDLLEEEHEIGSILPHSLKRQFSIPGEFGVLGDMEGASASSSGASCRIERTTRSNYRENWFQRSYSSLSGSFNPVREYNSIPQVSLPYMNGGIDGMIPGQWNIASRDLSMLGMKSLEGGERYPYYLSPEYSSMACGVNGYNSFRPPSTH